MLRKFISSFWKIVYAKLNKIKELFEKMVLFKRVKVKKVVENRLLEKKEKMQKGKHKVITFGFILVNFCYEGKYKFLLKKWKIL